jgi:hypothetical protein
MKLIFVRSKGKVLFSCLVIFILLGSYNYASVLYNINTGNLKSVDHVFSSMRCTPGNKENSPISVDFFSTEFPERFTRSFSESWGLPKCSKLSFFEDETLHVIALSNEKFPYIDIYLKVNQTVYYDRRDFWGGVYIFILSFLIYLFPIMMLSFFLLLEFNYQKHQKTLASNDN